MSGTAGPDVVPKPEGVERLVSAIESILLVAGDPVSRVDLATAVSASPPEIDAAIDVLRSTLTRGVRLQEHDGAFQLVTAPENLESVHRFLGAVRPPPLSRPALECLTIVAYRQPITRPEVEAVRGVNSDRAMQTLLARGLIEERGNRPTLGRPMEYGTSPAFLSYFGLGSLRELPPLPEESDAAPDPASLGLRTGSWSASPVPDGSGAR